MIELGGPQFPHPKYWAGSPLPAFTGCAGLDLDHPVVCDQQGAAPIALQRSGDCQRTVDGHAADRGDDVEPRGGAQGKVSPLQTVTLL